MNAFTITKHGRSRFWAVRDAAGELVCVCVYKRGAVEVARRLTPVESMVASCLRETPPEFSREPVREVPDATRTGG